MNKKNKQKRKNKKGREGSADQALLYAGRTVKLTRPGLIVGDMSVVPMHYWSAKNLNNAAQVYCNSRWKLNSAYDVDPLFGSTSTPGFVEMAAFYNSYRVVRVDWTLEISSIDSSPYVVYFAPSASLSDLGQNYGNGYEFVSFPYSRSGIVSAKGGMDRIKLSGSVDFAKLVGKQYITDDNFASAVNTSPANIVYGYTGAYGATALTSGFFIAFQITLYTAFYDRKDLAS